MRVNPDDIPRGYAVLRCETCGADIGFFDPRKLKVPMVADMFESVDKKHGFPPPFPVIPGRESDTATWEWAMCPYCGRRPFLTRDHVMTPFGRYKVGDPAIPRRETMEEAISRKNQDMISKTWADAEEVDKTFEEKNQEVINGVYKEGITNAQLANENSRPERNSYRNESLPSKGNHTPDQENPTFICPGCGAEYKYPSGLSRHKKACKKLKKEM